MWSLGIGVWWSTAASLISSLLSKLKARSTYFENQTCTKDILQEIDSAELLEKASIITTPTAYSDGVLHSVKPEQTLGSELVTNGNFATDSGWNKGTGWSISNNTAILDGSNTSGSIIATTINIVEGKTYQVIVDVDSMDSGRIRFYSNFLGSGGQADITSSGTFTYNIKATDTGGRNIGIQAGDAGTQSVINSISVKQLINADFTFTRNDAGTRVNASGNIESIGVDLPRIDYLDGNGSLLLEPQATNTATDSNDFTVGYMFDTTTGNPSLSNAILTSAQATSPDGTNNAWKFVDYNNGGTGTCSIPYFGQRVIVDNYNTVSLFVKKQGNNDWFYISLGGWGAEANGNTWFDIANGTLGNVSSNHTASIVDYGNGWYRCSITFQATTDLQGSIQFRLASSNGGQTVLRDGTNGVYIYGLQAESHATRQYATSYIPTSGSVVTRGADIATDAGSSDLINSTEGVFYLEVAALTSINNFENISLSDGDINNRISFAFINTLNRGSFQVRVGGVIQIYKAFDFTDITDFNKIAIKYKQNDFSVWLNGVKIHTNTSGTIPTLSELNFNSGSNHNNFNGKVKCVAVFKEALTDAELTALTS